MKKLQLAKLVAEISRDQSTAELNNAKAGSTQATAMYDLAMARNLLAKNGMDGLANHVDTAMKVAQIDHQRAQTAKTIAETHGAQVNPLDTAARLAEIDHTRAQTQKTVADTHGARMDAAHTGISAIIDALTPIQQPAAQGAGA